MAREPERSAPLPATNRGRSMRPAQAQALPGRMRDRRSVERWPAIGLHPTKASSHRNYRQRQRHRPARTLLLASKRGGREPDNRSPPASHLLSLCDRLRAREQRAAPQRFSRCRRFLAKVRSKYHQGARCPFSPVCLRGQMPNTLNAPRPTPCRSCASRRAYSQACAATPPLSN
jgi:hypothetical protein